MLGFQAIFTAMWCIFTIVGLRRILRSKWVVGISAIIAFTLLADRDIFMDAPGVLWVNVAVALIVASVLAALAVRMGLLATAACFVASFALGTTPWTFDPSAWYCRPRHSHSPFLPALRRLPATPRALNRPANAAAGAFIGRLFRLKAEATNGSTWHVISFRFQRVSSA